MKNIIIYIFLIGCLSANKSIAQNTNLFLLRTVEERVEELKPKLDLTYSEEIKLTEILLKSMRKLASLDIFSENLESERDKVISDRDILIKKELGSSRLKLFKLLDAIEKEALYEEYNTLIKVVDLSSKVQEELFKYRLKYVLPRLSLINQDLVGSMTAEDIIRLKELRNQYYVFSKNLYEKTGVKSSSFSEHLGPELKKDIGILLRKFDIMMESQKTELDKLRTKWSDDQDLIVADFLEDQNLSNGQKSMLSKGQFRIKEELFNLHVLMVVPFDNDLYLQNLHLVFNQQQYFQQITK